MLVSVVSVILLSGVAEDTNVRRADVKSVMAACTNSTGLEPGILNAIGNQASVAESLVRWVDGIHDRKVRTLVNTGPT